MTVHITQAPFFPGHRVTFCLSTFIYKYNNDVNGEMALDFRTSGMVCCLSSSQNNKTF